MRPEGTLTDLPGRSVGETRGAVSTFEVEAARRSDHSCSFFAAGGAGSAERGLTELVFERVRIGTVGVADAACDFVSVTCL